MMFAVFDEYIRRWQLQPDGEPLITPRASLLAVTRAGEPAMLKVAGLGSEVLGNAVLSWWAGQGAVAVLASDGAAVLLERAPDSGKLLRIYEEGRDEEAISIIASVAVALHARRITPPPEGLTLLATWFAGLPAAAERLGGVLHDSALAAATLFDGHTELTVLHGDLHHENVLHFGERGWLAIDPKGVLGERTFEYVPQLIDPDDNGDFDLARLERQIALTATVADLDPNRLRRWLLAWAGLQAVWWLEDGKPAEPSLRVAGAMATQITW